MASESQDLSISKLQSLQRTLASRGKSLRARGIRGKADEAAEKELKFRRDVGLGDGMDKDAKQMAETATGKSHDANSFSKAQNHGEARAPSGTTSISSESEAGRKQIAAPVTPARENGANKLLSNAEINREMKNASNNGGADASSQAPVKSNAVLGLHSSLSVQSTKPLMSQRDVEGRTRRSVHSSTSEGLEQLTWKLSNITVSRGEGRLPWKQERIDAKDLAVFKDYQLPLLESFTTDKAFISSDGALPRRSRFRRENKRNSASWRKVNRESARKLSQGPNRVVANTFAGSASGKHGKAILKVPDCATFVCTRSVPESVQVLSQRFSHLVKEMQIPKENILVVTISNKNATNIKQEVGKLLGGDDQFEAALPVRTFHSMCLGVLRMYGEEIGLHSDFDICGALGSKELLTSAIRTVTGLRSNSKEAVRYRDLVTQIKHEMNGELRESWIPATYSTVQAIRETYDNALREKNQIDFNDVVIHTYRLFQERPDIVEEMHKLHKHVLVDAWQGAHPMHSAITSAFNGGNDNLFIVSDSDRSVFKPDAVSKSSSSTDVAVSSDNSEETNQQATTKSILENLNPRQRDAVVADPSRACLVMAGPGSGKTRVLTHRFAYLVKEHKVPSSRVLAVTFTNKAANEMKERIEALVGHDLDRHSLLSIGTFHSVCLKFLRLYGDHIGLVKGFSVCDTSDSRSVISRILKNVSDESPSRQTIGIQRDMVSKLKNDIDGVLRKQWAPFIYRRTQELREKYDEDLKRMNLLDFDDLLLFTRRVLQEHPEVLDELCDHYQQVLVDEWQDTNGMQFEIVSLLASKRKNLFVVGDTDQSIYKFRGADVKNVRRFHHKFKNALQISLDQNYRSTQCIVKAAQAVIAKNPRAKGNAMITENDVGRKLQLHGVLTTPSEASFVATTVSSLLREAVVGSYSEIGVLYRTNAQSRAFEQRFISQGIPYRLHSGVRFFERQEVKDIVSYMKVIANVDDDVAFRRIVNKPARGIGPKTLESIERFAEQNKCSMADALFIVFGKVQAGELQLESIGLKTAGAKRLAAFYNLLYELRKHAHDIALASEDSSEEDEKALGDALSNVGALVSRIVESTRYGEYLALLSENEKQKSPAGRDDKNTERMDNIDELRRYAGMFSNVGEFLDNVALVTESDRKAAVPSENGRVSMMTIHGGKGLEFPVVFIVGAEDNLLPIKRATTDEDVQEERRLFYVGMTRAQKLLYISWRRVETYMKRGKVTALTELLRSRFVDEIPSALTDTVFEYRDFEPGKGDAELQMAREPLVQ
ncbi:ATP-dependent DNA helicase PcrA [Gracilariopsis chorda]|uniref:DNA 3'-5' helicase n=1 Tax=Gracilariopsis chorda TaxID=448386 RepID=A0A2V3IX22_9FLOR|nr:ATP-dependent DNA helicase PcrA [Gracilariopsis chorda]|eukprot:PXF46661.1 ATP-dependent DNA helicase PcrA [Gracilariopsis chorda]